MPPTSPPPEREDEVKRLPLPVLNNDHSPRSKKASAYKPIVTIAVVSILSLYLSRASIKTLLMWKKYSTFNIRNTRPITVNPNNPAVSSLIADRPWEDQVPRWCAELITNPLERPRTGSSVHDCNRGRFGAICDDGRPRFFSQYNQDIWTWQNHWKYLRRRGVYLDIAANEPVRISNSYFFDRCLNWRGICVEAHPAYHNILFRTRSCAIVPTCVSDKAEKVSFIVEGGLSGISETNKNSKSWEAKHVMQARKKIDLTCVKTSDAIAATGIQNIDMLSLDVEGHEYKVLKGIDWNTTRINVIVIETLTKESEKLLLDVGYRMLEPLNLETRKKQGNLWSDFVFLYKDVEWGKPV